MNLMSHFIATNHSPFGILITKNTFEKVQTGGKPVYVIPAWMIN